MGLLDLNYDDPNAMTRLQIGLGLLNASGGQTSQGIAQALQGGIKANASAKKQKQEELLAMSRQKHEEQLANFREEEARKYKIMSDNELAKQGRADRYDTYIGNYSPPEARVQSPVSVEGLNLGNLQPHQIDFLRKQNPEAFKNGVTDFGSTSKQWMNQQLNPNPDPSEYERNQTLVKYARAGGFAPEAMKLDAQVKRPYARQTSEFDTPYGKFQATMMSDGRYGESVPFGKAITAYQQDRLDQSAENAGARNNKVSVTHGVQGLSEDQKVVLNDAISSGRLDPNRLNSKTASLYADQLLLNPAVDMSKISSDIALGRNSGFRQKAMTAEVLPEIMASMVDAGKRVDFSKNRTIGKIQAYTKGEFNDPDLAAYMAQRNDALMTIAGVMRGNGMTDMAHKAEVEASAPTMDGAALDAWFASQMKSLQPRLDINRRITRDTPKEKQSASAAAASDVMPEMPKPNASNQGKTIVEHDTGKKYRSNGLQWVEVK